MGYIDNSWLCEKEVRIHCMSIHIILDKTNNAKFNDKGVNERTKCWVKLKILVINVYLYISV